MRSAPYGAFEEALEGSLGIGKLADLVVLQHDPFRDASHELGRIESAATVEGSQIMCRTDDVSIDQQRGCGGKPALGRSQVSGLFHRPKIGYPSR